MARRRRFRTTLSEYRNGSSREDLIIDQSVDTGTGWISFSCFMYQADSTAIGEFFSRIVTSQLDHEHR